MTGDELLTAGNQGRLGFVRSYYWGFFADIDYTEGALWYDYVSIPPLEGPNGVRYANWNWQPDRNRPFVITSKCENPEVLVQWADTMFELEGTIRGTNGNPDNWWWATEGEVGINGEQAVWGRTEWPAPAGTGWDVYSLLYNSNSFRLGQVSDPENPDLEAYLFEATKTYEPYQQPREMQLPPLIFDESQAATRADIAVTIENHVRSHMAEFAVAERDINDDAAWEEYVSAFDAIGLPDVHRSAPADVRLPPDVIGSIGRRRMRDTGSDRTFLWVTYALLVVFTLSVLYPLIFVLSASVSSGERPERRRGGVLAGRVQPRRLSGDPGLAAAGQGIRQLGAVHGRRGAHRDWSDAAGGLHRCLGTTCRSAGFSCSSS